MIKVRKSEIWLGKGYVDQDTMIYSLPEKWKAESLPKGTSIQSKFGNYSFDISAQDNKITCIRYFTLTGGSYSPGDYKQFFNFMQAVSKSDNTRLLFTKAD